MSSSPRTRTLATTLLLAVAALTLVVTATPTAGAAANSSCKGGTLSSGTYDAVRVTHACTVPKGARVTINGTLRVTGRRAVFLALTPADVLIKGNVVGSRRSVVGLGVPNEGKGCPQHARVEVRGDVIARRALTVYLDCTTIHGNVRSVRGGARGFATDCESRSTPTPLNFVIKDNLIFGRTTVRGWNGCWMGYIRNVEYGSVRFRNNSPADKDSMEIVTNRIYGNLACSGNTPDPQIGDSGGTPNTVFGHRLGQCAML